MRCLLMTATALLTLGLTALPAAACPKRDFVRTCYQRYLSRPVDEIGMNWWVPQLEAGVSYEAVQAGILGSDEYYYRRGGTPEGFVVGLYADVLGRTALPHEIGSWVYRLLGHCCHKQLAVEFVQAAQVELAQRALQQTSPPVILPAPPRVPPPIPSQELIGYGPSKAKVVIVKNGKR